MPCPTCSTDKNPLGVGVIEMNNRVVPCPDCHEGWQKLCFGLQFHPQTDEETFRTANLRVGDCT